VCQQLARKKRHTSGTLRLPQAAVHQTNNCSAVSHAIADVRVANSGPVAHKDGLAKRGHILERAMPQRDSSLGLN